MSLMAGMSACIMIAARYLINDGHTVFGIWESFEGYVIWIHILQEGTEKERQGKTYLMNDSLFLRIYFLSFELRCNSLIHYILIVQSSPRRGQADNVGKCLIVDAARGLDARNERISAL